MTPTQLRKALITLGWPAIELRRRLNASDQTIWRWRTGIYPIPHAVADWLTARVRYEKGAPPPPENWTKTPGRKPRKG